MWTVQLLRFLGMQSWAQFLPFLGGLLGLYLAITAIGKTKRHAKSLDLESDSRMLKDAADTVTYRGNQAARIDSNSYYRRKNNV